MLRSFVIKSGRRQGAGLSVGMAHHLVLTVLTNLLLGLGLGVAGGLLGIGGGLIAIPILGYLYGMDQHLAQGTALVMIAPNVLIGFLRYHQRHPVHLRSVAALCAVAMASTYVAARFAAGLDADHLRTAFAWFLIVLAVYFGSQLRDRPHPEPAAAHPEPGAPRAMPPAAIALLGIASGGMSGIFTVGGGLVVVPALVTLFGMSQTRAQGMALALVVPGSLIALATYAHAGHVSWGTGIPLALGGMASVSWGVALAHRFSPMRLRLVFCAVLVGAAAAMLVEGA
ncbi:sulfite exporter TauE/SafE family protein (plasmid) [Ralstonia pseudosolanacearum]|nr:sulfite exporter TauE/SafE family protein [Ralstonia pseudosolanacearum]BEU58795.1 sulfite exporter TauE/SafE family protein [Ralstonia pseudosolanacearum]BEU63947.1 sulfite exporter TauE/SafE family protein [Ralstonia pseudosolanacearum]